MKRRAHFKAAALASFKLQHAFKAETEASSRFAYELEEMTVSRRTDVNAVKAHQSNALTGEPLGGAISPQAFRLLMECQAWQPQTLDLDAMCALARAAVRSTVERRACAHEVAILKASDAEIDRTHAIYRAYRRDVDAIFRRLNDA